MGCLSHRRKETEDIADQKWDYINLGDFKSKGCGTIFAYGYLWFSLVLSIAVYAVDSFTAVNLLVFNKWSSQIEPAISLDISKWIFSVCIILSFLNLGYEGVRAFRVIRRENIAESYLDNLAVRWESIRLGSGQGWRRFLVFAELTKSKKGAEYIALFTYFSFQTWIRVIICSAPRQVVNAFTLKSVYEAKLAISSNTVEGSISGFFDKIQALAAEDYQQALILSAMCFTMVIWIFSALSLLLAVLFYVLFLFHWIPRADGGLSGYCERKVTQTLMKIVTTKVNTALAKQESDRFRAEMRAAKKNGEKFPLDRQGTLPTLPNVGPIVGDKLPEMPMLMRNDTMATLPPYTSNPGTPGTIELGPWSQKRPIPSRTGTMTSAPSYSSRAPLVGAAAEPGYGRSASPAPSTLPEIDTNVLPPQRTGTSDSQGRFGPRPPLAHMATGSQSSLRSITESPGPMQPETIPPFAGPVRSPTSRTMDSYTQPMGSIPRGPTSTPGPRPYDAYNPNGRAGPAPTITSTRAAPGFPRQPGPMNPAMRSATGPLPPRGPQHPPSRNMTAPMPPRGPTGDYFDRPSTSQGTRRPPMRPPYGYDVEAQGDRRYQY